MCHQTVSLIARHLEAQGIATVIVGCAYDIVRRAGAPRFYFSNFPLGHSAGKPFDSRSQQNTLFGALALLESAQLPGTCDTSPQRWSADERWQRDYMNIDALSPEQIQTLREEFRQQKASVRTKKT